MSAYYMFALGVSVGLASFFSARAEAAAAAVCFMAALYFAGRRIETWEPKGETR